MAQARVFVPQDAVESWLSEGRADLSGDTLTFDGHTFRLASAVRFLSEVSGAPDETQLVGKVKSREQLEGLLAEHTGDSVVLGDNAYEVQEGYLLGAQSDLPVSLLQKLFT